MSDLPPDHVRYAILFKFESGATAAQAAREINYVYGEGSTSESTCDRWYRRFRSGDKSLKDEARPGRPMEVDESALLQLIRENSRLTTIEIAEHMKLTHTSMFDDLYRFGFKSKLEAWIPHDLTYTQKWQWMSINSSLLSRYE